MKGQLISGSNKMKEQLIIELAKKLIRKTSNTIIVIADKFSKEVFV